MPPSMSLGKYREKRPAGRSPEPRGRPRKRRRGSAPHFVIQHHAASTDHYDFRLEIDGVLASWAVPKGPSVNPKDKRMARRTEDHPMDYEDFEGVIPEGQYGAGRVIVWDRGTYTNESEHDMADAIERGHLSFRLDGEKLHGGFALTRFAPGRTRPGSWSRSPTTTPTAAANPYAASPSQCCPGAHLTSCRDARRPRPRARKSAQRTVPSWRAPTLATLTDKRFSDPDWIFERKLDGVRCLAFRNGRAPDVT